MKKLTTTAAIALALVSGAAVAERGSAAQNGIDQPNTSSAHTIESRSASPEQVIAKNGRNDVSVTSADSHASTAQYEDDRGITLDLLQARNGATGEQTLNADLDSKVTSVQHGEDRTTSLDLLQARNGATGEQTIDANAQNSF